MTGRAEVERLKQQLDATFKRAVGLRADAELLSDFARYLCVLVSGFLEQAIIELLLEHVRGRSEETIQRFVERELRQFHNPKVEPVLQLFGQFDAEWRRKLDGFLVDEYKDAVDSVVSLRNRISHGQYAGVTMKSVSDYYARVCVVVNYLATLVA